MDFQQAPSSEVTSILLVDDEPGILDSLEQLLRRNYKNFRIETAASAEEALAYARSAKVDVLITDFKLPKMNGLELAHALREFSPDTKAILMTAYGNDAVIYRAEQHGCLAYLEKPLDISLLCRYIDKATETTTTVHFEGDIFTLPDLVHFFSLKRETVVLTITTKDSAGLLAMERGLLVHARFGDEIGVQALLTLLDTSNVTIKPIHCALPSKKSISVTWFALSAASEMRSSAERSKLLGSDNFEDSAHETSANTIDIDDDNSIEELVASFKVRKQHLAEPTPASTQKVTATPIFRAPNFQPSGEIDEDLTLQPERELKEEVLDCNAELRKSQRVSDLVNIGIQHFRAHRLNKARDSWKEALRLDPECRQATDNLKVLEELITLSETKH